MSWYNEPRRHALSAKGIKTAIEEKPLNKVIKKEDFEIDPLTGEKLTECPICLGEGKIYGNTFQGRASTRKCSKCGGYGYLVEGKKEK